jgi:GNAT superfamily N-acetyltransferase
MDVTYRTARKADCLRIAELIDIASGGVVEFLFHDLMPGLTPQQIIAHNLESDQGYYTYKNAIVAETESRVVGVALSFPARFHEITAEMRQYFPKDRLDHLTEFYAARVDDSLLLNALSVDQKRRRKGIGGKLIALTKKKARQSGFKVLSLMVFADNREALSVYYRHGFEVLAPVQLYSDERIPHEGGCYLMKSNIEDYK